MNEERPRGKLCPKWQYTKPSLQNWDEQILGQCLLAVPGDGRHCTGVPSYPRRTYGYRWRLLPLLSKGEREAQIPVNEGIPHAGSNGARLGFIQLEDTLHHRQLCARCVLATEGTPVVHHHPSSNYLAASVHSARLPSDRSIWIMALTTRVSPIPGEDSPHTPLPDLRAQSQTETGNNRKNPGQRDLLPQELEVRKQECLPQGGPEGERTTRPGLQLKSWDVPGLPDC